MQFLQSEPRSGWGQRTEDRGQGQPWPWVLFNDLGGFNLKSRQSLRNHLKQVSARATLTSETEEHPSIHPHLLVGLYQYLHFWSESQPKAASWLCKASAGCKDALEHFWKYCTLPPDEGNPTHVAFFCVMSQTVNTNMSIIPINRESLWAFDS